MRGEGVRHHHSGFCAVMALAVVLCSVSCARVEKPSTLDGLLAFDDPAHCVPSADLKRLTQTLLVFEGEGQDAQARLGLLQAPEAYRSQIGAPVLELRGDAYNAHVPLSGTWRGLKVRDVAVAGLLESEGSWWISFDAPWSQVLREANAAGFGLDREGRRIDEGEVMDLTVAVERDPSGGARLRCSYG
ncbi:hypothetical protein AS593_02105 [Caulobacter vibrioides]|nr:hypothetical protein AS593_02105 [Caulobacter vibrioides]